MNMTDVIVPKSDQINADDLIGRNMTITIRDVQIRGGQEQPVSIFFDGSDKAFRPCKSMSRVLVAAWGADAKKYIGRSLTLYRDAEVKWGGMAVGGIRISHMTHIDDPLTLALTATKGSRKPFRVLPLTSAPATDSGPTLDDARDALNAATSIDDLATAWKQRWMAPFRDELAGYLDERKAALTPMDAFGLAPLPRTYASACEAIDKCETADAVNAVVDAHDDALIDEDAAKVRRYAGAKIAELSA